MTSRTDSYFLPAVATYAIANVALLLACGKGMLGRTPVELILFLIFNSVVGLVATGFLFRKRNRWRLSRFSVLASAAIFANLIAFNVWMLNAWLSNV